MADLRTCYFCGTGPGGSLDSYGVVPSALDPSPDEQRSVVLCPDCRNKLMALLKPVVAAAEGSTDSGGLSPADDEVTGLAGSAGGPATGSDRSTAASESSTAGQSTGEPASGLASTGDPASESAGSSAAAEDPADDPADATRGADDQAASTDEPAGGTDEPAGDTDGPGTSTDESGTSTDGPSAGPADGPSDPADESSEGDGSDGELAATSSGDGPPSRPPRDPSAESLMGDNSEAYRKVIRLLQNREFPIHRAEIEELAASAYELGPSECSDAIDTVIQKGLLVEEEGTLRRPAD